jgi:hypothetical protein
MPGERDRHLRNDPWKSRQERRVSASAQLSIPWNMVRAIASLLILSPDRGAVLSVPSIFQALGSTGNVILYWIRDDAALALP